MTPITMTHIDIIKAFGQGQVNLPGATGSLGNCASIALIKAGIEVFGLGNLFQLNQSEGDYQVKFKNGITVSFTQSELDRSNHVADFRLNESEPENLVLYRSIRDYAQIALCAMVKRVMEIGESGHGISDFEKALLALNDGANTPSLPEKLGLENNILPKKMFRNAKGKGLIGWLKGHTVYISHSVRDDRGTVNSDVLRFPKRMQVVAN
jgi:hypothetical protein